MSETEPGTGFWMVIKSVFAAFFGVQSSKQHAEDFAKGKPIHYIVVGLLGALVMVVLLVILVRVVMSLAGA